VSNKINSHVIILGNFDGLHRGHRALIAKAQEIASLKHSRVILVGFNPHPLGFFNLDFRRLFTLEDQKQEALRLGVDKSVHLPFTQQLAQMTPQDFLDNIILKQFNPLKAIVVGFNFQFGNNKSGNIDFLKKWAQQCHIQVSVVEPIKWDNQIVSSSLIKTFILNGEIERANEFLGRVFYVHGKVKKGDGRGQSIGFPTANLEDIYTCIPSEGVYVTQTELLGFVYSSVTHIGPAPTFKSQTLRIESHIFDFDKNIRNQEIKIYFYKKLRDVVSFSSKQELVNQIQVDSDQAKKYLQDFLQEKGQK